MRLHGKTCLVRHIAVCTALGALAGGCGGGGGGGGAPPASPAADSGEKLLAVLRGPDLVGQLGMYFAQTGILFAEGSLPFVPGGAGKRGILRPSPARGLLAHSIPWGGGLARGSLKTVMAALQVTDCELGSADTETIVEAPNRVRVQTMYADCRGTVVLDGGVFDAVVSGTVSAAGEDPDYAGVDPANDPAFDPTIFELTFEAFRLQIRDPSDPDYLEILEADGSILAEERTDDQDLGEIEATLDGAFAVLARDAQGEESARLVFDGLHILYEIRAFGPPPDEEIVDWSFTLDGRLRYEDRTRPGQGVEGTFDAFRLDWLVAEGDDVMSFNGGITSDCVGGAVVVETLEPLAIPLDEDCPTSGRLLIQGDPGAYELRATAAGGVEIDVDADGTVDRTLASCTAVDLCPL